MSLRWQLWESDFHNEVVLVDSDSGSDEEVICSCGRGVVSAHRLKRVPRLPRAALAYEFSQVSLSDDGQRQKRGRGRARLIRENADMLGRKKQTIPEVVPQLKVEKKPVTGQGFDQDFPSLGAGRGVQLPCEIDNKLDSWGSFRRRSPRGVKMPSAEEQRKQSGRTFSKFEENLEPAPLTLENVKKNAGKQVPQAVKQMLFDYMFPSSSSQSKEQKVDNSITVLSTSQTDCESSQSLSKFVVPVVPVIKSTNQNLPTENNTSANQCVQNEPKETANPKVQNESNTLQKPDWRTALEIEIDKYLSDEGVLVEEEPIPQSGKGMDAENCNTNCNPSNSGDESNSVDNAVNFLPDQTYEHNDLSQNSDLSDTHVDIGDSLSLASNCSQTALEEFCSQMSEISQQNSALTSDVCEEPDGTAPENTVTENGCAFDIHEMFQVNSISEESSSNDIKSVSLTDTTVEKTKADSNYSKSSKTQVSKSSVSMCNGTISEGKPVKAVGSPSRKAKSFKRISSLDEIAPGGNNVMNGDLDSNCSEWLIIGENVVQMDGLPPGCDTTALQEVIGNFGTVIDHQVIENHSANSSSIRFKLTCGEACDFAVQCLHDSDCLFPESNCVLVCYRVPSD